MSPVRSFRDRNVCERLADQLRRLGVGLGEDLGVLDVVERLDHEPPRLLFVRPTSQRLERALANIDSPYGIALCHTRNLCSDYCVVASAPRCSMSAATAADANRQADRRDKMMPTATSAGRVARRSASVLYEQSIEARRPKVKSRREFAAKSPRRNARDASRRIAATARDLDSRHARPPAALPF